MFTYMSYTVYEHITPSGKRYIGITSKEDPKQRWRNGKHYKKGTAFRFAIDKYGWNDIQHNILFNDLTEKEAKWLENYLICYYRTYIGFKDCKGYNLTLGGEGCVGFKHTESTKRKISEKNKGKHPSEESIRKMREKRKDYHHSEEAKRKMSEVKKGKHRSEETRKKISEGHKGKHHSEETRHKQSASLKGKPSNVKGKHWKLIDGKRVYYE